MVVRDVRHRWNYTHAMIERGLLLRKIIDTWVFERDELRPLSLKPEEWKFLKALGALLKVCFHHLLNSCSLKFTFR
ncbi:hypothetical protein K438DRAFT_1582721 [Mycena galopus ATCC 62051]|nr:hypothetical protein K438DRAFT_1593400 [Mycena galopus ATCC 62051]KAF8200507.1 hypothetical protein K438DRAFT_1582721 [Mycena galopus ATCC 62051]